MSGALLGRFSQTWCPSCSPGGPKRTDRFLQHGERCQRCGFSYPTSYTISAHIAERIVNTLETVHPLLYKELLAELRKGVEDDVQRTI